MNTADNCRESTNDSSTSSNRHLLSLVNRLCKSFIPNELIDDNNGFENICKYSIELLSKKKLSIEDCEEQYLLSKIRQTFMKKSALNELINFEDLYLNLKQSLPKTFNLRELLYCLYLLSNSGTNNNATPIFSISNSIEAIKIDGNHNLNNDNNNYQRYTHHFGGTNHISNFINNKTSHTNRPNTVHVYHNEHNHFNDNSAKIISKYTLLAKDLLSIFQGLPGRFIKFEKDAKLSIENENNLFYSNEIYFAKRLSVLGQNFQTIKAFGQTSMNSLSKGFVVQSFGSALIDEINNFYKLLTSIQANLHAATNDNGHASMITLHKLCIWTTETSICFDALITLIGKCRHRKGGSLIAAVYDSCFNGNPLVRHCYRKILSKIVKPIRKMLNHWIFFGELKDDFNEFFIYNDHNNNPNMNQTMSDTFWYDQYSINNQMLPGFIDRRQAYKILITGKAISLLREVSMNRISNVLPSYDQLKCSFEKSNLELLFDYKYNFETNNFPILLDYVYKEISQKALNILNGKYQLYEHFLAHKRFILFEQGDFISYLMELLYPLLNRPVNRIRPYTLTQTLENCLRKTSVQYYYYEHLSLNDNNINNILSRIDIYFDPNLSLENAWQILTLKYRIDGPLLTIFNLQNQQLYTRLFSLIWQIKTNEYSLNYCWLELNFIHNTVSKSVELNFLKLIIKYFNYLLYQLLSFLKTLENYYNYLIESNWQQVQNELNKPRNLNKLIKIHQNFLRNLMKKIFFNENSLVKQQNNINKLILKFISKLQTFINEMSDNQTKKFKNVWNEDLNKYQQEMEQNYIFWLHNFSNLISKEISMLLELLIDNDEDEHRELCFNIDFNKYYKLMYNKQF